MSNKKYLLIILLLVFIFSQSCLKDKLSFSKLSKNIEWDPSLAAPGIYGQLSVLDMIQDYDHSHLLQTGQDGFLTLVYKKDLTTLSGDNLIPLPSQSFYNDFNYNDYLSAGGFVGGTCVFNQKSFTVPFITLGSEAIDSIIIKQMTINITVASSYMHNGTLMITFPGITKNGIPYKIPVTLNGISGVFNFTQDFSDLAGYNWNMATPTPNLFSVQYDLTLNEITGNPVLSSNDVYIAISFNDLRFSKLYGDVGQLSMGIHDDTVQIGLFNKILAGNVYFQEPKITFGITSSYGLPLEMNFDAFKAFSTSTNTIQTFGFPAGYNITCMPGAGTNSEAHGSLVLDTNSFPGIRTLLSANPKYLIFGATISSNPTSGPCVQTGKNFVYDTSKVKVNMTVELPMYLKASFLVMQDTSHYNFMQNINHIDMVDKVLMRLNIDNGMPLEVSCQIDFADSLFNVLFSAFPSTNMIVVPGGIVDSQGKVVQKSHKTTDIILTGSNIQTLKRVRHLLYRGYVATSANASKPVKFYTNYAIDIAIGVMVNGKINTSNL